MRTRLRMDPAEMMDPEMFADVMVFALYTSSEPTVALVPETLRAPFLLSHDRTSREMERVPRRHTCCLRSLSCDTRLTRPLLRRRTARGRCCSVRLRTSRLVG